MKTNEANFELKYSREMFRSDIFSTIWAAFNQKKTEGMTLSQLAEAINKDKGYLSRLLSQQPNCKTDIVSDIAFALNLEPELRLIDRRSGVCYSSKGASENRPRNSHIINQSTNDDFTIDSDFQYKIATK